MSPSIDTQPPRQAPEAFGRYRLLRPLAAGGMAEVYIAEMHGPLGFRRRVALKRVLPHLRAHSDFIQAFVDEARVGGLLVHPHIVQILDFDFVDEVPYLAMEYVEGGHFGTLLDRARRLKTLIPFEPLVALFLQAARGLQFAHDAHDTDGRPLCVVHRDLKPSNLLIGRDGQVKIADFGIAKASSNLRETQPDMVKGSLPYMSPEQAGGERELTAASDLFSMGSVLYELVTTERLFRADTPAGMIGAVLRGPRPELLDRLDALPAPHCWLGPIARRLLEHAPGDRYDGAGALVRALEALDVDLPGSEALAGFVREWLGPVGSPGESPQPRWSVVDLAGPEPELELLNPDGTWTFEHENGAAAGAASPGAHGRPIQPGPIPATLEFQGIEPRVAAGDETRTPAMAPGLPNEVTAPVPELDKTIPELDAEETEPDVTVPDMPDSGPQIPDTGLEIPATDPEITDAASELPATASARDSAAPESSDAAPAMLERTRVEASPASSSFIWDGREAPSRTAHLEASPPGETTPVIAPTGPRVSQSRSGGRATFIALAAGALVLIAWLLLARLQTAPQPSFGVLNVLSEPRGATVLVRGREVGRTPVRLRLPEGEVAVEIMQAGHPVRTWSGRIQADLENTVDFPPAPGVPASHVGTSQRPQESRRESP